MSDLDAKPRPAPRPVPTTSTPSSSRGASGSGRISGGVTGAPKVSPAPPTSTPSSSRGASGGGNGSASASASASVSGSGIGGVNPYVLVTIVVLLVIILSNVIVIGLQSSSRDEILGSQVSQIILGISSIVLILTGVASLVIGQNDIQSWWGFIGFVFILSSSVPLSLTLTTVSMESLNSPGASLGVGFASLLLTFTFSMIYYSSTGSDTMRTSLFYGSMVLLLMYTLFYTIVFGNPVGIPTDAGTISPTESDKYLTIYKSDESLKGAFKRRLFDQVYLSVAYPTLTTNDSPPLHNSDEIMGTHYLSEYGKYLKKGASAFLFDIFYEGNTSSPNVNSWRVGTINTRSGVIQNRRTISLSSVLNATNRAVDESNTRLIYLFLNPRYLTSQKKMIPQLENQLATLIRTNVTHNTLPSLSVTIPQNIRLEDQTLENARQQVVIFLGGTRNVSSLSPKLKNVIHGVVNLTDCYIKTEGAQRYNAIAYDPEQSTSRLNLGTGSFAGSNENRLSEFVPEDSLTSVQSAFVATLPNESVYTNDIPVFISHSVSFPFVYPRMMEEYYNHRVFFQGFAPIVSPKKIISMIFYNQDGEDQPARQRRVEDMRCTETYKDIRVLNPANDAEWGLILSNPQVKELRQGHWCENYKDGRDGPTSINPENPVIFPLVLYNGNQQYSGGMIPKPTLVQTTDGAIYQLRRVINQTQIQATSLEK